MPPKVSVCITAYNYAHKIGRAIASVLMQDFQDYEIIVSDDASTDNTTQIVHGFSDSRIRYFRNSVTLGFPGNMNRILELAQGEYVVFLCADDFFFQGFLSKEVQLLNRNPSLAFVHCATVAKTGFYTRPELAWPEITSGRDFIIGLFSGKKLYLFSSIMARRKLILKVGGFDMFFPYNTDEYTWLRLALEGDVGYIAECLTGNDCIAGELSKKFTKAGRYVIEELRLKSHFIDLASLKAPEFAQIRHKLSLLLSNSTIRNCLSLRRRGEDIGVIMGIWKRCVLKCPITFVNPYAWLCLTGAILPAALLRSALLLCAKESSKM